MEMTEAEAKNETELATSDERKYETPTSAPHPGQTKVHTTVTSD